MSNHLTQIIMSHITDGQNRIILRILKIFKITHFKNTNEFLKNPLSTNNSAQRTNRRKPEKMKYIR